MALTEAETMRKRRQAGLQSVQPVNGGPAALPASAPQVPRRLFSAVTHKKLAMANSVGRLIAAAIAMVAGAVACTAEGLSWNVGVGILLVAGALFLAEYVRSQTPETK